MNKSHLTIGITGHRFIENEKNVKKLLAFAIGKIIKENKDKKIVGYSCLALGADTFFAEYFLKHKLELNAVLPFDKKEYSKDFEYSSDKKKLKNLIHKCNRVNIVSPQRPQNTDERDTCYLNAGKFLVNECDIIISLWDGKVAIGKGGSADIIAFAKENHKIIIDIKVNRQNEIEKLFRRRDEEANILKSKYESNWKFAIIFSLLAAFCLAFVTTYHHWLHEKHYLKFATSLELFFLSIALIFVIKLLARAENKKRLIKRIEAEKLRIINKFYLADIKFDLGIINNDLSEEFKELVNYEVPKLPEVNKRFDDQKKELIELIDEQHYYHSTHRPEKNKDKHHKLELAKWTISLLFVIGSIAHCIFIFLDWSESCCECEKSLHDLSLFLCLALPPVYAAIEGYIFFKEYEKINLDSKKMAKYFAAVKHKVEILQDTNEGKNNFKILATEIKEKMDEELENWYEIMKEKRLGVG